MNRQTGSMPPQVDPQTTCKFLLSIPSPAHLLPENTAIYRGVVLMTPLSFFGNSPEKRRWMKFSAEATGGDPIKIGSRHSYCCANISSSSISDILQPKERIISSSSSSRDFSRNQQGVRWSRKEKQKWISTNVPGTSPALHSQNFNVPSSSSTPSCVLRSAGVMPEFEKSCELVVNNNGTDSSGGLIMEGLKDGESGIFRQTKIADCAVKKLTEGVTVYVGRDLHFQLSNDEAAALFKEIRLSAALKGLNCLPTTGTDGTDLVSESDSFYVNDRELEGEVCDDMGSFQQDCSNELTPWVETDSEILQGVPLATVQPDEQSVEMEKDWLVDNIGVTSELLGVSSEGNADQTLSILQSIVKGSEVAVTNEVMNMKPLSSWKGVQEIKNLISEVNYEGKGGVAKERGRTRSRSLMKGGGELILSSLQ